MNQKAYWLYQRAIELSASNNVSFMVDAQHRPYSRFAMRAGQLSIGTLNNESFDLTSSVPAEQSLYSRYLDTKSSNLNLTRPVFADHWLRQRSIELGQQARPFALFGMSIFDHFRVAIRTGKLYTKTFWRS